MTVATVLLADDEDTLRQNLARVLEEEGFDVIACRDGDEAFEALKSQPVDALVTDLRMPGISGMELISRARELVPDVPIIVITAFGEVETAVEAMKNGARDYICKPLMIEELILKLNQLLATRALVRQNRALCELAGRGHDFSGIVAQSPQMREILETIRQVSSTISNILFLGESGTGKEALARVLHYTGITREKAFVAVNCGGLTESLIESEFFGYRRGAFTGASTDRIGYFEAAQDGTLFLDEISSLPLANQSTLLRAIEEKAIIRVGDTRARKVNIRIAAAANSDLQRMVSEGTFREDLYYRLNVVQVTPPPLRERKEDVAPLAELFVAKYNAELMADCPGFAPETLEALLAHSWPGNVRELENVVERALIFARNRPIELGDLPFQVHPEASQPSMALDLKEAKRGFERQQIAQVLEVHEQNKVEAAKALGIGLSSLYRKLEEHSLDVGTSGDGVEGEGV